MNRSLRIVIGCAALVLVAGGVSTTLAAQRRGGGPPAPANGEIANFSLVQTVGCLVEASPRTWRLTQATDVAVTKDVPASEAELKTAAGTAAGTQTLRLVSILPFKTEEHRGQRVLLKGIINRYPGEDPLLNVTGLYMVAATCG